MTVNQQLHMYKNTFVIFSACHRSHTADPEDFFHAPNSFLEVEENALSSSQFLYLECSLSMHFSGISSSRLNSKFELHKAPHGTEAPRHLAPIKSFRPHGSKVSSSSSSSFCLAAGRANLWASCSFLHKLLILFNCCAKTRQPQLSDTLVPSVLH